MKAAMAGRQGVKIADLGLTFDSQGKTLKIEPVSMKKLERVHRLNHSLISVPKKHKIDKNKLFDEISKAAEKKKLEELE